jgi:nucleotide-binding universal stress UspA family protein
MLKNLVVNLPIEAKDTATSDYAITLARTFGAHLAAVAFAYEAVPVALMGDDVSPEWIDEIQEQAEKAAKAAVAKFEEGVRGSGISAESRWMKASFSGTAELFSRIARRFDLSIVRQSEPDKTTPDQLIVEAALFDSGRPVLVVPYIAKGGIKLDRVLVCWDGSRGAARAAGDAIPFLRKARAVDVVVVGEKAKSNELPGADIAESLARHGVKVEVKEIIATDIDAADVILSHAADSSADLMVMGGYGHSRLREFVLGGVTRTILSSMIIPVLMSH